MKSGLKQITAGVRHGNTDFDQVGRVERGLKLRMLMRFFRCKPYEKKSRVESGLNLCGCNLG